MKKSINNAGLDLYDSSNEVVVSEKGGRAVRSAAVEEIISSQPDLITRWGTPVFLFILCFIVFVSWFIRYPEIVPAAAKLTSINAPKTVISPINAKLVKLLVTEGQNINLHQTLGYLESTGDHEDILSLSRDVDSIQLILLRNEVYRLQQYFYNPMGQFGELQLSYQVFLQSFLSFQSYLPDGFYLKKLDILQEDLINLKRLHKNLIAQRSLQEKDLSLTHETFEANEYLKREGVISDFDYRSEQSKFISKQLSLPQINSLIINNESQQNEKEKEILELKNVIDQQKYLFNQAVNTFKSQIDDWKRRYMLVAPIEGRVAFASFIQENQQLIANQVILYVNPQNSAYFAELSIPQSNFGKVQVGQQVMLRFQSYPFQEYGTVDGKIQFISHIPLDSGYLARVEFTQGLRTTYHKEVQYREGLLATAEIVTRDMSLLERFYYNSIKALKR